VTAAIVLDGLVKRYGDRAVVDGVSLQVSAGEIVALLGPNGAGKTTTVEIVEGYRRADAGSALVLGQDPAAGGRELRARVGLMLQGGGIDMRARPRETLRQYASFHADPRDPDELLDVVGLRDAADTRYRRLSGGERQRLGLALALVGRPEVVLLDEPTAGMDPEGRAATRRIVADLRDAGVAILLTSHDLADVERLADRIAVLVDGRIVAAGTPAQLAAGLHPRLRLRFERSLTAAQVGALAATAGAGARVVVEEDWYAIAEVPPSPDLTAAIAAWAASEGLLVVESRSVGGSLEDAYLALVGTA
jgi:ABC-2 type transport system ATP-binding protein